MSYRNCQRHGAAIGGGDGGGIDCNSGEGNAHQ